MSGDRLRVVAAAGLVIGAVLGMAGSFTSSPHLRSLAWGLDGIAIIVGCALLVAHHLRESTAQLAADTILDALFKTGCGPRLAPITACLH